MRRKRNSRRIEVLTDAPEETNGIYSTARSRASSWKGNKAAQEANWCSAKTRFTLDDRQQKSWSLVFRNLWLPLNLNSLVPHQCY
jgi:hypothetical protein